jgi:hypothetical protein
VLRAAQRQELCGRRDRQTDVTVTTPVASGPRAGRQHPQQKRDSHHGQDSSSRHRRKKERDWRRTKGQTPPKVRDHPRQMRLRQSTLRPAPRTKATSSSRSAPTATPSSPASRSWSIPPAASSASAARWPTPRPVRLTRRQPPRSNSTVHSRRASATAEAFSLKPQDRPDKLVRRDEEALHPRAEALGLARRAHDA